MGQDGRQFKTVTGNGHFAERRIRSKPMHPTRRRGFIQQRKIRDLTLATVAIFIRTVAVT